MASSFPVYLTLSEISALLATIRVYESRQKEKGFPLSHFMHEANRKLEEARHSSIIEARNF